MGIKAEKIQYGTRVLRTYSQENGTGERLYGRRDNSPLQNSWGKCFPVYAEQG